MKNFNRNPGDMMSSAVGSARPGRTTIDLGPDGQRHKESLNALAGALGLGENISELMRWLAETYSAAAAETVAFLQAARDRAAGGDEWNTLAIIHDLLPPITLAADESSDDE